MDYSVVIPTTGRASLGTLLRALGSSRGPHPAEIIVVDDRRVRNADGTTLDEPLTLPRIRFPLRQLRSAGRGPAAARNVGWRAAATEWIAFLDDDVVTDVDWTQRLSEDLDGLPRGVAASVARIAAAVREDRRPTDQERDVLRLSGTKWTAADVAYRRAALIEVGGFDERFPRAFREDADLALRVCKAGYRIAEGRRVTTHPVHNEGFLASVRRQRHNADDALMRAKHGRHWRSLTGETAGRLGRHAVTTLAGVATLGALASRNRLATALAGGMWTGLTAELTARRILSGPVSPGELARMLTTSPLIPPTACAYRLAGELRIREPAAVLFDRDDTLIETVPSLTDPERVRPLPGVASALRSLRDAGVLLGVVSNRSGMPVGSGASRAVDARVDELLGPFQTWQVCPHRPGDACPCRRPKPGLVLRAADALGVDVRRCVVVGDTGADVDAAAAAGALGVLVPSERTRSDDVTRARKQARVAPNVAEAVRVAMDVL
ncbi:HAD-IIIA family hydrolase [Saccharomonospora sp. NPDC006951]